MALQSRLTVYAAIAGVLALMGGIVYYASLDNVSLNQVEIQLTDITLRESGENESKFNITYLVKNHSEKTFTVSLIAYELFGDGQSLGSGEYSTEDVALPGRAIFYAGSEVPLKSTFVLSKDNVSTETYEDMVNDKIAKFVAEGIITTQTTWSIGENEFRTEK